MPNRIGMQKAGVRVYADSTYHYGFPILVVFSLSIIVWMLWVSILGTTNQKSGALFCVILMAACLVVLPFCFVDMGRKLYCSWIFLPEGIQAVQREKKRAVLKPYSSYRYLYWGTYMQRELIQHGKYRGFLILSTCPIPTDLLRRVNALECSSEIVIIKITRDNLKKIFRVMPAWMKPKVNRVLQAAGMPFDDPWEQS